MDKIGNVCLKARVHGHYKEVMEQFDRDLFEALAPKSAPVEIVSFTGSKTGDKVHLRFKSPINADWISDITDHGSNDDEAYFIDEGRTLPFPLKYWKHRHIVRKVNENESEIIDDMYFSGPNKLITALMKPAIFVAFSPRKKIYQTYFSPEQRKNRK